MLILSRKSGESIVIDGRIHVKIVRVEGEVVKVGIEAAADVPVHRLEVYEEIQRSNQQALTRQNLPLPKLAGAAESKKPGLIPTAVAPKSRPAKKAKAGAPLANPFSRPQPQNCPAIIVGRVYNDEKPLAPSPGGPAPSGSSGHLIRLGTLCPLGGHCHW